MTRRTNARIAGVTFLLYIGVGITQLIVFGDATDGENMAARLATMAQRAAGVRIDAVLTLATCIIALTLGAALYAMTARRIATSPCWRWPAAPAKAWSAPR